MYVLQEEGNKKIALAVSGGSDSIALLYIASIWSKKYQYELHIFSVDHNLRPESKQELQFIKEPYLFLD